MFEIAIANEQISLTVDEALLESAVKQILTDAGLERATVSIAIVDNPTIHRLNVEFLDHDYETDVLSFVLEASDDSLDGEIIASADYAISGAQEYGWPAMHELLLYIIHGTLHLVGHDDLEDAPRAIMREREKYYLRQSGIEPPAAAN